MLIVDGVFDFVVEFLLEFECFGDFGFCGFYGVCEFFGCGVVELGDGEFEFFMV